MVYLNCSICYLFRITVHVLGTIMKIFRSNSLGTSEQVLTTERVWRSSVLAPAAVGTLHVLEVLDAAGRRSAEQSCRE